MPGTKQEKAEAKKSTEKLKAERQSDATDDETLKAEENGKQRCVQIRKVTVHRSQMVNSTRKGKAMTPDRCDPKDE